MITLEQIRAALAHRNIKAVCEATGLHENTVRKIKDNPASNPKYETYKTLIEYLSSPLSDFEAKEK